MKLRGLQLPWIGISGYRHPRIPGGPRVWTLLVRVGRKKRLL